MLTEKERQLLEQNALENLFQDLDAPFIKDAKEYEMSEDHYPSLPSFNTKYPTQKQLEEASYFLAKNDNFSKSPETYWDQALKMFKLK